MSSCKKIRLIIFSVFSLTFFVFLQVSLPLEAQKNKPTPETEEVKTLMHEFYSHIIALKPFMTSEEKFNDKKNEPTIRNHLRQLSRISKKADHSKLLNSPNFTISKQVLQKHIDEVERVFKVGNKDYAKWMLNSTLSVCISCHTQLPQDTKTKLPDWNTLKAHNNSFEDAEFLYATRQFDEALKVYTELIQKYPKNNLTNRDLDTASRRVVAIFARIKRNPNEGASTLSKLVKNKKLPDYMKENINAWIGLFNRWKKEPQFNVKKASNEDIQKLVETQMKETLWDKMITANDPRVVTYLRVSGILYEYLHLHPKSDITPKILLWLASFENKLNNEFFFSLGDLYLKECMTNYPKTEAAKECFEEYEDNVVFSYTGSRGTYIPPDVRKELEYFKKLVGYKKPIPPNSASEAKD